MAGVWTYCRAFDERNQLEKPDSKKKPQKGVPPHKNQTETKDFNRNPGTLNRAKVVLSQRTDRTLHRFRSRGKVVEKAVSVYIPIVVLQ